MYRIFRNKQCFLEIKKESDFVVFGGMSKGTETRERDWDKNLQIAYERGETLF